MIRSCGCRTAVYAAKFAGEPEYGWTFTCHSSSFSENLGVRQGVSRAVWMF